ncbi:MAG: hypothetical protein HKN82_10310 [Akkermansiaceae bacterium]|nr:hypothetical protein [Akkermansiaceae bacterium]NNM28478.1 hypothetical protein [Akkermansiaceae bacterium]
MGMNVGRIQQPKPDYLPSPAKGRGKGRFIRAPLAKCDRSALLVILAMTAIVWLVLSTVSGLWTIMCLLAGPMLATLAVTVGRMGGPVWARITAAAYTGALLTGTGLVIAATQG